MKFMSLWRPKGAPKQPDAALFQLITEMKQKGVLISTGGWDITNPGTFVKRAGADLSVTDGPYAESKEVIAGFAILEVASREEAVMWSKRFLGVVGDGTSEIRQLFEPTPDHP